MGVHSHLDHQLWTTCSENEKGLKRSFLSAQSVCLVTGNFSSTIIHPTWWYKRRPTECKIPAEKVLQVYSVEEVFSYVTDNGERSCPFWLLEEALVFNHSSPGLISAALLFCDVKNLVYDPSFYGYFKRFFVPLCYSVPPFTNQASPFANLERGTATTTVAPGATPYP